MRAAVLVFLVLFGLSCFVGDIMRCHAKTLAKAEVDTLKVIGEKLKMSWDFSVDPCSGAGGWVVDYDSSDPGKFASNITCDCNTADVCHVTRIQLKTQNLTGVLPAEFANLTHLTFLDLNRNYLSGSIPKEWASLPLTNLSLLGNRVSGRIPDELGNMSTLQSLELEANLLEGPIPETLGKLTKLFRLSLSSNNFSGQLPESLGNLKNLFFFFIDGNPISGKIPSFIGNWTQLERLDMLGTSLEGPFPDTFTNLTSITHLYVSDIKGFTEFPPLQKMKSMYHLILRNLSISGQLPVYIGDMKLLWLDLSFNNLSGSIPERFSRLQTSIHFMFLTSNILNGAIPTWILSSNKYLDLSYNNFSGAPEPSSCQRGNLNFASSYSPTDSNLKLTCLQRNFPCSGKPRNYNLFINCGGRKLTIEGIEYEDDSSPKGASSYNTDNVKWASSSTGIFMGNGNANYIATNASLLNMSNTELYMQARLSPLSLRYHGFCLQKGNYNVSLHFAEIMFTNDQTFSSTGRRLFDVAIQGHKLLQDFDIAKEAKGTGQEIIKSFNVDVNHTLEILFYWAGKGTISIPNVGVYGPLVSAISVTPNFKPDTGNKISTEAILGVVAGASAVIILILLTIWFLWRRKTLEDNEELRRLQLHTNTFSLKQIKAATNNFDPANMIGEGGFGRVYKGVLPDGLLIAVKQLSSKSMQGNREFITEVGMISALEHPNLVKLYGCGIDGNQLLLIYEYMENNSLARALFGPVSSRLKLDWQTRRKICLQIARGLAFLHEESTLKIVHRDIKATNILLDRDLNAKISDFGLAKLDDEENTHISTRIAGTVGYMAPEYATRGYLTDKADVYSFGVVILEIVSGMSNTSYRPKEDFTYLLDWAYVLKEEERLLELVDTDLGSNYSKEEALLILNLCLSCTSPSPTLRPRMSTVVSILEGKSPVQLPSKKSAALKGQNPTFKALEEITDDSHAYSMSTEELFTASFLSITSMKEEALCSSPSKALLFD